jgi:hypothetical protein
MSTPFSPCRHRLASPTATTCSECGLSLTLGALGRHYGQRLVHWLKQKAVIACPWCGREVALYAKTCPHCWETITVQASFKASMRPLRRRWQERQPNSGKLARALALGAYFLGSVTLLGWQIATVPLTDPVMLVVRMGLSIVILAVAALVSFWVVPRHVLADLAARLSPVTKLAVLANYLGGLLLLQSCLGGWLVRSLILVALLACTWVAAWVLHRVLWPVTVGVREIFRDGEGTWFDSSQPQGRHGGFE